jgi:H+/Cl- antiporter ClcA
MAIGLPLGVVFDSMGVGLLIGLALGLIVEEVRRGGGR